MNLRAIRSSLAQAKLPSIVFSLTSEQMDDDDKDNQMSGRAFPPFPREQHTQTSRDDGEQTRFDNVPISPSFRHRL